MNWYKKRYGDQCWAETAIFNRFEALFMAAGAPLDMVMVEQEHDATDSTIWLALPDRFVSAFPEFKPAGDEEPPKELTYLIGDVRTIEALQNRG